MTTDDKNISRAARLLSMRPQDIKSADEAPAGFVMTTFDGVTMVDVPEDRPDGAGKTGLMLLVKPNPEREYTFPVYTPHPESEDEPDDEPQDVEELGQDLAEAIDEQRDKLRKLVPPPRSGRGSSEKAWREFADAAHVDVSDAESRDDVIAACEAAGVIEPEGDDG